MNSGLVGWGCILIKSLPHSPREKLGEPDLLREVAGPVPHLYLLWRLEHSLLPGAHHACLPSVGSEQPAPLAERATAWGSWVLRSSVNCAREGRLCQCVTGQLPSGHHLGCSELERQDQAMAAYSACGPHCPGYTPGALCPGKVSECQRTKHPRGTSSLGPQGPHQAIISILITDIC